tara:strand:+ start:3246 stop:4538 length:1293 start_codon:yes stop_codon:yes gene_type:complete
MKVIFVQLNEINFDIANAYIKKGYNLNFLKKVLEEGIDTFENEDYENLEPWIQWFSIFKGKPFKEHRVFRLGDGLQFPGDNVFSDLTNKLKIKCGAISPMNISGRNINFDFFIPDPWSNENIQGNLSLKLINDSIKQGVNDNSGRGLNFVNKVKLLIGLLINLNLTELKSIFKFYKKIKNLSFRKALFLDYLLVILQRSLTKKNKTQFTSIFLNAGAHIQHHYLFNSKVIHKKHNLENPSWYIDKTLDPLGEALLFYNDILNSYQKDGYKIILMTGLQQVPYDKINYYYRLSNHKNFLKFLDIKNKKILPRMTRDFEIIFENNIDRDKCIDKLDNITDEKGIKIFNEIEIREKSIFSSLTYNKEIKKSKLFKLGKREFILSDYVNFVALKNGKHDKKGKLFISNRDLKKDFYIPIELSQIRDLIFQEICS